MCNCITKVNARLAEGNGQLAFGFMLLSGDQLVGRLLLQTEKVSRDKPLKASAVWASFCPFCGVEVKDEPVSGKRS